MSLKQKPYLLENSIGYIIRNFTKALRESILETLKKEGFDITIEEWIALAFLWRFDDKNQQQLGELLLQDKTAVTRLVDNMENNGFVKRTVNQQDKRNKIINLTEAGKKLYKKIVPHIEMTLTIAQGEITKEDLERSKAVINQMKDNLLNNFRDN